MNEKNSTAFGYARVSSEGQNPDRQLSALHTAGVLPENISIDHMSGKDFNRPAWKRLVRKMKSGDVLVVSSIDRFGRNYEEILSEWRRLVKVRHVHVRVLDMPLIDTTTAHGLLAVFIADLVLQILSFVAETERTYIRSRQREGIAAAKARGVKFGRPRSVGTIRFPDVVERYARHELTISQAAKLCGMARTSFWRMSCRYRTAMYNG